MIESHIVAAYSRSADTETTPRHGGRNRSSGSRTVARYRHGAGRGILVEREEPSLVRVERVMEADQLGHEAPAGERPGSDIDVAHAQHGLVDDIGGAAGVIVWCGGVFLLVLCLSWGCVLHREAVGWGGRQSPLGDF